MNHIHKNTFFPLTNKDFTSNEVLERTQSLPLLLPTDRKVYVHLRGGTRGVSITEEAKEKRRRKHKKQKMCHWPYLEKQENEHIYVAAKPNKTQCQGKSKRHTTTKAQSKA